MAASFGFPSPLHQSFPAFAFQDRLDHRTDHFSLVARQGLFTADPGFLLEEDPPGT